MRPAAFTDDPPGADYKHGTLANAGRLALKIPRADIADFMLAQMEVALDSMNATQTHFKKMKYVVHLDEKWFYITKAVV